MGDLIFITLSTVVALYAAYLLNCCLYKLDYYSGKMKEKVVFPRIVYFLAFIAAFVPILNLICVMMLLVFLCMWSDDYRVKSWLFDKPEEKEKADSDSAKQ